MIAENNTYFLNVGPRVDVAFLVMCTYAIDELFTDAAASAPLNMDSANNMMPGCDLLFELIQEGEIGNDK